MPTGVHLRDARQQLFDAAERILLRAGPNALTSRAVTDEAGCAKGVLHRYFTDFDAFLADLVLDEMALTRRWVLAITGSDSALSHRRVLGRAVQLRSPYIDALSLLQLRALKRLRTGAAPDDVDDLRRLLLLTVNGVAAGLQNTG